MEGRCAQVSGDSPDDAALDAVRETSRLVQKLRGGLRVQSLISLALAALLLVISPVAATSSLLGSLAVYLPGLMFTVLTVRKLGGDTAAFLRTATLAESGKLLLTGVLCALVFVFVKPLAPGFFFLGMIVTLAVGWAMLVWAFNQPQIEP
jgi:F0F1-type ATP synthase assembly protein I